MAAPIDPEPRASLVPAITPVPPATPLAPWIAALLAAATATSFGAGLVAGRVTAAPARAVPIACALPPGLDAATLPAGERAYLVRRTLLCQDAAAERVSLADYRAAVARLDAAPPTPAPAAPLPAMLWGATVRDLSSQYGTSSWAAHRALGAPDVFPAAGDQVNAWASLGADDRVEHLEVGLERPARLSAVEVLETYNPGAVSRIELVTAGGARQVVYQGAAGAMGQDAYRRRVELGGCTAEPIVAIRVTVDSPAVPGWNELDAIGGAPCAE